MMRIRVIPLTIFAAVLFMAVKLTDVARGTEALSEALFISKVQAQQPGGEAPKKEEAAKPEEKKPEEAKKEEPKKEEPKKEEPKKEAKPETKKEGEHGDAKKAAPNPNVSTTVGATAERSFSKVELELLENLGKRREELERWETNIQVKEAALDATEKRINDKITQIEAMKKDVSDLLAQYNQQEDTKIKSLVKIYENMKPKDAARIFDEIEMPILLLLIDKMAEKKASPILSEMSPQKAKQVTVELAAQRQINNAKFNTLTSDGKP